MTTPVAEPAQPTTHEFEPKMFQGRRQFSCEICGYMADAAIHCEPKAPLQPKPEQKYVKAEDYDGLLAMYEQVKHERDEHVKRLAEVINARNVIRS
jgi:hypothetical protein